MTSDIETKWTPFDPLTLSNFDQALYEYRIRQQKSLRDCADLLDCSHMTVSRHMTKILRTVTFAEVDEMRTEQGNKYDELASMHMTIARACIAVEPPDIDAAQKALRHALEVNKAKAQLFGLDRPIEHDPDADMAAVNAIIEMLAAQAATEAEAHANT